MSLSLNTKKLMARSAFGVAAALLPTLGACTNDNVPPQGKTTLEAEAQRMFSIMDFIRKNHIDSGNANDGEKTVADAINGMLKGLDPHSHYFTPDEFKKFNESSSGSFGGLGIEITNEGDAIKVVSPIEDSPAWRAGLQSGDLIVQINEKNALGLSTDEGAKLMRGEPGTPVTLKILRKGIEKPFDVPLVREIIKTPPVKSALIDNDIGYVKLKHYSYAKKDANGQIQTNMLGEPVEDGATLLRDAILSMKAQMGSDAKGYVLDLRGDPGGYLYQAVSVSDHFLAANGLTVVSSRGRDPNRNTALVTEVAGDITDGKPLIILVDAGSASASEVTAGALQDHKRAIVLGQQTFGKGSVQSVIPLRDGSALKLTTEQYFTPLDRSVQGKGITPDIEFKPLEKDDLASLRRRESSLSHSLGNTKGNVEDNRTTATCSPASKDLSTEGLPKIMIDPRTNKVDAMLACAVENLRGTSRLTVTTPVGPK
jgi:carboxyl-terminal processing protease